jgi:hypothetical protein
LILRTTAMNFGQTLFPRRDLNYVHVPPEHGSDTFLLQWVLFVALQVRLIMSSRSSFGFWIGVLSLAVIDNYCIETTDMYENPLSEVMSYITHG